ncbi:MAG: hypothetical protein M3083_06205 [Actinomycetota bacterium]|nr:hypothetical protein [Actinomycetota bacterium]
MEVHRLPDPANGLFDAAGDFDRLVDDARDRSFSVWSMIDPYACVTLASADMPGLLADLNQLTARAKAGPELRGLGRLRVMAEICRDNSAFTIRFVGD